MALMNTALLRMMTAVSGLRARFSEERGQDLLEYALLGGLIAAALVAAGVLIAYTGGVTAMADGIANCIDFDNSVGSECNPF